MRQSLDVSVRGVKLLALVGLLVVGLLLGAASLRGDRDGRTDRTDANGRSGDVDHANHADPAGRAAGLDGSATGSATGTRPRACAAQGLAPAYDDGPGEVVALVRGGRGVVRPVSFEQGWAVYRGLRPGTLVAVCRSEPSP